MKTDIRLAIKKLEKITSLSAAYASVAAVAESYGVSRNHLRVEAKKRIPDFLQKMEGARLRSRDKTMSAIDKLIESGLTLKEACDKMGLNYFYVCRIRKQFYK